MSTAEVTPHTKEYNLRDFFNNPQFQKLLGQRRMDFITQDLAKKGGIFQEEIENKRDQITLTQEWRGESTDGMDKINKTHIIKNAKLIAIEILHDFLHHGEGTDDLTQIKIKIMPDGKIYIETFALAGSIVYGDFEPLINQWSDPDIAPYLTGFPPEAEVVEHLIVEADDLSKWKSIIDVTDRFNSTQSGEPISDGVLLPGTYVENRALKMRSDSDGTGKVTKNITIRKAVVETHEFSS